MARLPPDIAAAVISSSSQVVGSIAFVDRSREDVLTDHINHANRARAYEAYGEAIAKTWLTGSFLCTVKPELGRAYVQTALALKRTQRKFEDETRLVMAALSSTLLYASNETQAAAAVLLNATTSGYSAIAVVRDAGGDVARAQEEAGVVFSEAVVAWRAATWTDLAPHKKK